MAEIAPNPQSFPGNRRLEDLKVLVFEETQATRAILHAILKALRISDISWANSYQESRNMIAAAKPDIVIADSLSGAPASGGQEVGSDGLRLLQWIREDPSAPHAKLPVILLNDAPAGGGRSDHRLAQAAQQAGAHDILAKPLSLEAIHDSLTQLVHRPPAFIRESSYFGPDRRKRQMPHGSAERRRPSGARAGEFSRKDAAL